MQNKKGFEMAITTVTVFAALILALAVISLFVFFQFGTAGAGVSELLEGSANKTGEFDVGSETTGIITGGVCSGTPALTLCGYYYQTAGGLEKNTIAGHRGCKVPSCRIIGGYARGFVLDDSSGRCLDSDNPDDTDSWRHCPVDCSKFTEVGRTLCECAGCFWTPN